MQSIKPIFLLIFLFFIGILLPFDGEAQCSMCKAVAETGTEGGAEVAKGLNTGIIYLMGIPYLLLMTLFGVFFRKRIKGFMREMFYS